MSNDSTIIYTISTVDGTIIIPHNGYGLDFSLVNYTINSIVRKCSVSHEILNLTFNHVLIYLRLIRDFCKI